MVSVLVPRVVRSFSPGQGNCVVFFGKTLNSHRPLLSMLSQCPSPRTQEYKWVPANCRGNLKNCGVVTCDALASRPGELEILLTADSS